MFYLVYFIQVQNCDPSFVLFGGFVYNAMIYYIDRWFFLLCLCFIGNHNRINKLITVVNWTIYTENEKKNTAAKKNHEYLCDAVNGNRNNMMITTTPAKNTLMNQEWEEKSAVSNKYTNSLVKNKWIFIGIEKRMEKPACMCVGMDSHIEAWAFVTKNKLIEPL